MKAMRDIRAVAAVFLCAALPAHAGEVTVNGLFPGKAIIQVDGGRPRTLAAGETTPEGVKLISATSASAVIEYQGKRETLAPGEGTRMGAGGPGSGGSVTTLTADPSGHFFTTGTVNGLSLRLMVDTGASMIVMSASDARRLGIRYLQGERAALQTANGIVRAYRVKLDAISVGAITAHNVDAVVTEAEQPIALLGMSFLNRTEMRRDGDVMTLTRRY
ncbi:MAG TPA: TIGR02281 family clan AA aspartic protease [Burkholderiales bacterium]|nr:TIGR02281 family clan AA aspartic protease [Burkholderiales bacterium]